MFDNMYNNMFMFFSFILLSRLILTTLKSLIQNGNTNLQNFLQGFLNNDLSLQDIKSSDRKGPVKIGVLTNELPPVIYGGVATWVVNFLKMFRNHPVYDTIPIFLAYLDDAPESFQKDYPGIRVIHKKEDLVEVFKDIDLCVNNLWIANETIIEIKCIYQIQHIIY